MDKNTDKPLADRKAIVSGGASGIGKAIAEKLCLAGIYTAIADLPGTQAFELSEVPSFFSCDITRAEDIASLFSCLSAAGNLPDILVCNAGRGIHEKLSEGDPEKWKQVLDLNVMGALRLIRAFVPAMLAAGQGDVVFISSVSAGQAYPYGGVYAASKSALTTIAETLRLEVSPSIRVSTVAPGVTQTSFLENSVSGHQTVESIGFGALSPEDVAEAVMYALSQPPEVAVNQITVRPRKQPF